MSEKEQPAIERESSDKQRLMNAAEKMGRKDRQIFLLRFNVNNLLFPSVIYFCANLFLSRAFLSLALLAARVNDAVDTQNWNCRAAHKQRAD